MVGIGKSVAAGLRWIAENEGLRVEDNVSASALAIINAKRLARPNQKAHRKLQDDCWWLTPHGREVLAQLGPSKAGGA